MDLDKLKWQLIEMTEKNYSDLKKLNRVDQLGLHINERTWLMDQNRKLRTLIEDITANQIGSDLYATIKNER